MPRGSSLPLWLLLQAKTQTTKWKGGCAIPPKAEALGFPRAVSMKLIEMGDLVDALVEHIVSAIPYVEEDILRGIISENIPECGLIIEASRDEIKFNRDLSECLYHEVKISRGKD